MVDVLLATNMIAVGVDVDRLGLMAVMGQPQTTAEYIQATSRVGRAHPGLVAVMLNAGRSRDRSHYENFRHFHSALYREVESTSVTPFSARARDRGLHAVIVALARILIPAARADEAAGDIDLFLEELREQIRPRILERVEAIAPEEVAHVAADFDEFVDWWYGQAQSSGGLYYEPKRGRRVPSLLKPYNDALEDVEAWETLWSLRDVDAESALFVEASMTSRRRRGADRTAAPARTPAPAARGPSRPDHHDVRRGFADRRRPGVVHRLRHRQRRGAVAQGRGTGDPRTAPGPGTGRRPVPLFRRLRRRQSRRCPGAPLPLWHHCPECQALDHVRNFNSPPGRNECGECSEPLVPSRFVVACEDGHIADFPYWKWLHRADAVTARPVSAVAE